MAEKYLWSLLSLLLSNLAGSTDNKIVYKFQEFFYKGNSKNVSKFAGFCAPRTCTDKEMAFREFESACEQSPDCTSKTGPARSACIQKCISPSCHQDLYGEDPLEEGEIDVRLNSFKGCFIQRLNRPRQ